MQSSNKLENQKHVIWVIAALWLVLDILVIFNAKSVEMPVYFVFMSIVFMPVIWWLVKLMVLFFLFNDFFYNHSPLLVAMMRYSMLFVSALSVPFIVFLKVYSFVETTAPQDTYPPADMFLIFAGLFYFALRGKVARTDK